jgi:probable HAF family extracellular repeat protein
MSRPVGSKKSVWIGGAPGFWGALTMMVALVFGVLLLCSGITTAQTASPPANENLADSQAINSAAAIPTYTIKDLGTLPDYPDSFATDVDDKGRVAGYAHNFTTGNTQAFLYEGGQMQGLGTLPGGTESFASGIADNRPVVGAATYDSTGDVFESGEHAFLYEGGQMQDLEHFSQ